MRNPALTVHLRWLVPALLSFVALEACDDTAKKKPPVPGYEDAAEGGVGGSAGLAGGAGTGGASGASGAAGAGGAAASGGAGAAGGAAGASGAAGAAGAAGVAGAAGAGSLVTFVEEFTSTTSIDAAASTATVDAAGVGRVLGPAPFALGDPGDGSDGAYAAGPTDDVVLAPGEYQYTSFAVDTVAVGTTGDLVIRVQGDLELRGGAYLYASGGITLHVGGQVRLLGGSIVEPQGGPLVIHQRGTAPLTLEDSYNMAGTAFASASYPIEVFSRGPLSLIGSFSSGDQMTGRSADVVVRVGDGITVGAPSQHGFIRSGEAGVETGDVYVYTERDLTLSDGDIAHWYSNAPGGTSTVRVEGGLEVGAGSYIAASPEGVVDLVVGGTFVHRDVLQGDGGGRIAVQAGAIDIASGGMMVQYTTPEASAPGTPAAIDLATPGNLTMIGGDLSPAATYCATGGSVSVRVGGDLTVGAGSRIAGGDSLPAVSGCQPAAGGDVTLLAAGTYTADPTATIGAGAGATAGVLLAAGAQAITVPPPEPGLITWTTVVSAALPVQAAGAVLRSATATWLVERREPGVLEIARDGTTWEAAASAVDQPLSEGWRYRVRLPTGQFDAAELDRVEVTYTVP